MLRDLFLSIGIPLTLLLLAMLALVHRGYQLPPWLQRILQRRTLIWNIGIGLIIFLSLLRWLLQR
jgi:hypothetical protein